MSTEEMKLALEAFKTVNSWNEGGFNKTKQAIKALEEALAKQEQSEPVACCEKHHALEFCPDCGSHIGADMRKALREASNEANELALAVWDALNRVACPEPFMRLAHDTVIKRYTTPQQRKPLTDEQIEKLLDAVIADKKTKDQIGDFARAIEAAHGIKENT